MEEQVSSVNATDSSVLCADDLFTGIICLQEECARVIIMEEQFLATMSVKKKITEKR